MADARLIEGDCLQVLPTLEAGSFDAVITDPPYELGFMGKTWDATGVAFNPNTWGLVRDVIKPGGYLMAFGGSRTQHRMACAIEDAGFEIRDCLMWLYGTGFPKGRGCLKPAYEPIILARKPGRRVLPLGIDECRVPLADDESTRRTNASPKGWSGGWAGDKGEYQTGGDAGRWPANVLHDGSDEVLGAFAAFGERQGGAAQLARRSGMGFHGGNGTDDGERVNFGDTGTAARFFYTAKASKGERGDGNNHPTVKPLALIRWLVRLICPPGGTVLDPFAGSGTTGVAALAEGRNAVLIEREPAYCDIIRRRLEEARGDSPLFCGVKP